MPAPLSDTQRSWDIATRNHNAHKGDQARFFREGGDVLFPEELELLGDVRGQSLVHLQCNAGQDSLCLAKRGAQVTGVDFSGEAVTFARGLAQSVPLPAPASLSFVQSELLEWLGSTDARFDVAFSSYGAVGWLPALDTWARGVARVLRPGGRFVYVEFHPLVWSFGPALQLTGDDYFHHGPYVAPVKDYVAEAGAGLGAVGARAAGENSVPAHSYQYGVAEIVDSLLRAGLRLETLREYPHSNGARILPALVPSEGRRYVWPPGTARLPLMFGLVARRPT